MRGTAFLVAMAFTFLHCSAQSWCPPGAHWYHHNAEYEMWGYDAYVETLYIGDTVIADSVCQRLQYTTYAYSGSSQSTFTEGPWDFYTTTDQDIVYLWVNNTFDTLFNFNALPDDHWGLPLGVPSDIPEIRLTVLDTGRSIIDEQDLRYQVVQMTYEGQTFIEQDTIYERIGPMVMYLYTSWTPGIIIDGGYYGLRCYEDVEMSYNRVGGRCDIGLVVSDEIHPQSFEIFPNPCTTQATVNWPAGTPVEQLTLTDASGRVVRQWKPSTRTSAQQTFSMEGLSSGMYTLQVRAKDGIHSGRILVGP